MVRFLASGIIKIPHKNYVIEIDSETLMTKIYRRDKLGKPAILINYFEYAQSTIDCLFIAMDIIYEHNERSNSIM